MDKRWILLFGVLFLLGFFVFISFSGFKSGNVVLTYEESFNQGDKLSGDFIINIEKTDSVPAETPILISFSKGKDILETKSMTLKEYVVLSDNPVGPSIIGEKEYYDKVEAYSVPIDKVISYVFSEKGEYELLFFMPDLDLIKVTKIKVN